MKPKKNKTLTPRSSSVDRQNPNKKSNISLEIDILALKANNNELSQNNANLRQEAACLKQTIDMLRREKFESEKKNHNWKRAAGTMDSLLRSCLNQVTGLTENLTNMMQVSQYLNTLGNAYGNYMNPSSSKQGSPQSKAHIIKPHMVNGHILHDPTIKLTRVCQSNYNISQTQVEHSNNESTNEATRSPLNDSSQNGTFICRSGSSYMRSTAQIERLDLSDLDNTDNNGELLVGEDEEDDNDDSEHRLTTIDEEPENARRQSNQNGNSTVLSGVFQDVTIYLSPLPQSQMRMLNSNKKKSRACSLENQSPSFANVCRPSTSEVEHQNLNSRQSRPIICGFPSTSRASCLNDNSKYPMCYNSSHNMSNSDATDSSDQDKSIRQNSRDETTMSPKQMSSANSSFISTPSTSRQSLEEENSNQDLISSKLDVMKELGLAPIHLANKTSTPLVSPTTRNGTNHHPPSLTPIKRNEKLVAVLRQSNNIELKKIRNSSGFVTDTSLFHNVIVDDARVTRRNNSNKNSEKISLKRRSSGSSNSSFNSPTSSVSRKFSSPLIRKRRKLTVRALDSPSIKRPSSTKLQSPMRTTVSPKNSVSPKTSVSPRRTLFSPIKNKLKESPENKKQTAKKQKAPTKKLLKAKISPPKSPKKRTPNGRPKRSTKPLTLKESSLKNKLRR